MTAGRLAAEFADLSAPAAPGMPDDAVVLAPSTAQEAATILDQAADHRVPVLMWGGGAHQGYGFPARPGIVLSTAGLNRIVDWSPADLTVIVEAGVRISDLSLQLAEHSQTAILPDHPGVATVGGVIAAGQSGWARLRYGPIRDRVLEVVVATGDGRVVRAGAPLVKNVTGYDVPRLMTGSFGSLGLMCRVALKLWPLGPRTATVTVDDAEHALATAYRPLAVIEEDGTARVYLAGTRAEVDAQAAELGGDAGDGLHWPEALETEAVLVARVPPAHTREAVGRVPPGWRYQAAFGVGEVRLGGPGRSAAEVLGSLRDWATGLGGAAVVERAPADLYKTLDPWGEPGSSLELQRRVKAAFDPLGICNPGRLPGKL